MQIFQDDIIKTRILVNEMNEKFSKRIAELEEKVKVLEEKVKTLESK